VRSASGITELPHTEKLLLLRFMLHLKLIDEGELVERLNQSFIIRHFRKRRVRVVRIDACSYTLVSH